MIRSQWLWVFDISILGYDHAGNRLCITCCSIGTFDGYEEKNAINSSRNFEATISKI
jgi:hypothetical protein